MCNARTATLIALGAAENLVKGITLRWYCHMASIIDNEVHLPEVDEISYLLLYVIHSAPCND